MQKNPDIENAKRYKPSRDALRKQTILITGAAGALGSAIANEAAAAGSDLVLLDKNERALNALYDQILDKSGIEAGLYPLDLAGATIDDYEALVDIVQTEYRGLNGLIHCAAELGQLAPLANADPAQWQKTFSTNVHGPVFLTSRLLTLMKDSTPASIIFTADRKSKAYWTCYAATKAAIRATMSALSDELDADKDPSGNPRVTCNIVVPAKMRSSLRSSAFPGEDPATLPSAAINVPAYLYLLSEQARAVNGTVIDLNN